MVASARLRGVRLNEKPAVPRISDLGHLYASSLGKLELVANVLAARMRAKATFICAMLWMQGSRVNQLSSM